MQESTYLITDIFLGLKLANLHSMAVDYVKTGQPAKMSQDLKPLKWPHFMEKVGKQQHQIYTSKKVLGQLYDQVERIDFAPAFAAPFDTRILQAYTLDESILQSAREIKEEYDAHMRRIMAQQEIKTEFEVWSTFVLQHSSTSNSFKYHEQIGEISMALKDQFRLICHERAGGKDYEHIGPFVAAMYEVTAREVTAAVEECHCMRIVGGQEKPLREMSPSTMPLMSFPWLFQDILGKIAKKSTSKNVDTSSVRGHIGTEASIHQVRIKAPQPKRGRVGPSTLESGDYLKTSNGTTRPGELLELFGRSSESYGRKEHADRAYVPSSSSSIKSSHSSMGTTVERQSPANDGLTESSSSSSPELLARKVYKQCFDNNGAAVQYAPKFTTSSEIQPGNPLRSQGTTEVVGPGKEGKTIALEEAFSAELCAHDRAVSFEPDDKTAGKSNQRLVNDVMMDLCARPDNSRDLDSDSFSSEGESAHEDVSLVGVKAAKASQLSKAPGSGDVDKEVDTEKSKVKKEYRADEELSYPSDTDTESDEVVMYDDNHIRLLDQLAEIAGDDCAEPQERE